MFDEPSMAKSCDSGRLKVECGERNPVGSFNFHATSMTEPVGHLLSMPKNKKHTKISGGAA
jgi:hypothetical protein